MIHCSRGIYIFLNFELISCTREKPSSVSNKKDVGAAISRSIYAILKNNLPLKTLILARSEQMSAILIKV